MNNWFEVRLSYDKIMANGVEKKVTEAYLVDAISHAEAEARAINELTPFFNGNFEVSSVRRLKIAELFLDDSADVKFYKSKIQFITIDGKSGLEKRTSVNMLIQADNITKALSRLHEGLKETMSDYEISSLNETSIMDIFIYGKAS